MDDLQRQGAICLDQQTALLVENGARHEDLSSLLLGLPAVSHIEENEADRNQAKDATHGRNS